MVFDEKFRSGVPGMPGPKGERGNVGPHYTPSVSSEGVLSWTNDGGLPDPVSVDLTGAFLNTVDTVRTAVDAAVSDAEAAVAEAVENVQATVAGLSQQGDAIVAGYESAMAEMQETTDALSEEQADLIASINGALSHGTDTALNTSGWPADAKATGDAVRELESQDSALRNGIGALAGISLTRFDGYYSNRYTIPTTGKWQSASYVRITDFPVTTGDTIVCGCSELRQVGPGVGEIRVYDSGNTQVASASIPATARLTSGFKFEYTVTAENADHLTMTVYGVGNATPTVGDYTNIVDAYCMIGEAAIPAGIVSYDDSDVGTELTALNTELDTLPLKGIANYEDVLIYRERLAYTATGTGEWQGSYQIREAEFPATEDDVIWIYCKAANVYGNNAVTVRTYDENGQSIYTHGIHSSRLNAGEHVAIQPRAGTVSIKIWVALISGSFDEHVPSSGDVAFIDQLVIHKNDISLRTFVNVPDSNTLPDYWETAIQTAEDTLNERRLAIAAAGGKCAEFVFITDTHFKNGPGYSPALINRLAKDLGISTVLVGGDVVYSHTDTQLTAVQELQDFYSRFDPSLHVLGTVGNHDINSNNNAGNPGAHLSTEQCYYSIQKWAERYADTNGGPYLTVYDNESQKLRILQVQYYDNTSEAKWWDDSDPGNPILSAIKEKGPDWTVVMFSHCYWTLWGAQVYEGAPDPVLAGITSAVAALNETGSYATVAAWMVGHVHSDRTDVVAGHLRMISTQNDRYGLANSSHGTAMTRGTATEHCMDIVQIDTSNRTIYLTRLGPGESRSYGY